MNAGRLKQIIDLLLKVEQQDNFQSLLADLNNTIGNLVAQPNQPQYQTQYLSQIERLRGAMERMRSTFSPAQAKNAEEIGAAPFFTDNIAEKILSWMRDNPSTPIAVQEKLNTLVNNRQEYVNRIRELSNSMSALGIRPDTLEPGDAEIGFLIPRSLFRNDLDGFIRELSTINLIIRAFSELATGQAEIAKVREISTSDPLLFFGLSPETIIAIGGAITWALDTLKRTMEIRELKDKTTKVQDVRVDDVTSLLDTKIKDLVEKRTAEQIEKLLSNVVEEDGRKNEQRNHISWALEALLARIERGMTVEVRLLAPTVTPVGDEQASPTPQTYTDLEKIVPQLIFPKIEGEPITNLPRQPVSASPVELASPPPLQDEVRNSPSRED